MSSILKSKLADVRRTAWHAVIPIEKFTQLFGPVRDMTIKDLMFSLNQKWVPTTPANPALKAETCENMVFLSTNDTKAKFIFRLEGALAFDPTLFASIGRYEIHILSNAETHYKKMMEIGRRGARVFNRLLDSELGFTWSVHPFVNRPLHTMPLAIQQIDTLGEKQGYQPNDPAFCQISLASFCGSKPVGTPWIWWSRHGVFEESVAGQNVATEALRSRPLFSKSKIMACSGGIHLGALGVLPTYIVFKGEKATTTFGHIHGNGFQPKPGMHVGQDMGFDVEGTTIAPAVITLEKVKEWASHLPANERAPFEKATSLDQVPLLPQKMYAPILPTSDAAIVEAMQWWVAYVRSADRDGITEHIVGTMTREGVVFLTIPTVRTPMLEIGGKPFLGGIVAIVPNGDHAECHIVHGEASSMSEEASLLAAFIALDGARQIPTPLAVVHQKKDALTCRILISKIAELLFREVTNVPRAIGMVSALFDAAYTLAVESKMEGLFNRMHAGLKERRSCLDVFSIPRPVSAAPSVEADVAAAAPSVESKQRKPKLSIQRR